MIIITNEILLEEIKKMRIEISTLNKKIDRIEKEMATKNTPMSF